MLKTLGTLFALVITLTGCGGSSLEHRPANEAHGVYRGTMDDGQQLIILVRRSGQFYFLAGSEMDPLASVLHGDASAESGRFRSSNAAEIQLTSAAIRPATLHATYIEKQYLSGSVDYGEEGTVGFTAAYEQAHLDAPDFAALDAEYYGHYETLGSAQFTVVQVSEQGHFSGDSELFPSCSFSGAFTAAASMLLYEFYIDFPDSDCVHYGDRLQGWMYHDRDDDRAYWVALTENRANGFFYSGRLLTSP